MAHVIQHMTAEEYQFEVVFIPQIEGGYTAEVPELPGCISEGESFEDAEKNITEAIELYLETLEQRGLPLPEKGSSKVVKTTITILKTPAKQSHV